MESYLVGLPAAAQALDVLKATIKRLIAAEELVKVTIGRRVLITVASIEAFYVRRPETASEKAKLRALSGRLQNPIGTDPAQFVSASHSRR